MLSANLVLGSKSLKNKLELSSGEIYLAPSKSDSDQLIQISLPLRIKLASEIWEV